MTSDFYFFYEETSSTSKQNELPESNPSVEIHKNSSILV